MEQFLAIVSANGKEGLVLGVAVLVLVFGLNRSGVAVTKEQKQAANVVLSLLLSGVQLLDPSSQSVVVATIASLGSALAYEAIRWASNWVTNNLGKPLG